MKNKKRSDSSSGEIHIHIGASHVGNDGTDRAAAVTSFVSCEMFGGFLTYSDFGCPLYDRTPAIVIIIIIIIAILFLMLATILLCCQKN
ncbi:MAG TPA: hypothetical protein VE544_06595 [Nitrososphaeraceae archaeon]|nr:hypothetical protein [Nitrososphaeraceae archaeon]